MSRLRFLLAVMSVLLSVVVAPGLCRSAVATARPEPDALVVPTARLAQAANLDRSYFIGVWETRNMEHGRDVRIFWTVRGDGSLDYDFFVDGEGFRGSTGTWDFRDGILYESWVRPDGSTGAGRAAIERIDDDTFKLTVIDNGAEEYRGLMRIYHRRAPPQTVELDAR